MTTKLNPARNLALKLLNNWSRSGQFADVLLSRALDASQLDSRDRSLTAQLFLGVIRRRKTLDCILQAFCSRPLDHLDAGGLNILRLGAYQIIFLERVPSYAAVDSAVRQAKKLSKTGLYKLINAILRSLDRSLSKDLLDTNDEFIKRALPLELGKWRYFDRDIFAGPEDDPADYIAQVFSCPEWLAQRWWARFDLPGAVGIALASVIRGPITLRPNSLRTSQAQLLSALANMDIAAGPLSQGPGIWAQQMPSTKSPLFKAGLFQPQGPTAMRAGLFSQVQPGQKVLDFCAGLGTKATHLAQLMDNKGLVVASDISAEKLRGAEDNASRLGISCIEFVPQDQLLKRFEHGTFDVVLVDVPCSNTGVLASRPDAKWRIRPQYLKDLARTQLAILQKASEFVAPDGRLVYSTCSIEPTENDELTTQFLHSDQAWVLETDKDYIPTLSPDPANYHDGGYTARWRRK